MKKHPIALCVATALCTSAWAADKTWDTSGGSESSPLDISTLSGLVSSDTIKVSVDAPVYLTNGLANAATEALCNAFTWTKGNGTFLGDMKINGAFTGTTGSLLKRGGNWTVPGTFFVAQNTTGTFAFTNDTGDITGAATLGNNNAGRLQIGYGNNATSIFCQNGGKVSFPMLLTGAVNGQTGKGSKNWYVHNGGTTTFSGESRLGCTSNTTYFVHNGGTTTFDGNVEICYSEGATNYWTLAGGTTLFNSIAYIGYAKGGVVEWRQSEGTTEFASAFNVGNGEGAKVALYHSGGSLTIRNDYLRLGNADSDANDTYFEISGGAVSNLTSNGRVDIAAEGQLGSRSELKVKGNGSLYVNWLFNVGFKGAGILTVEDDGLVEVPNKSLSVCSGSNAASSPALGEDCYVNLNGGTLLTQGVRHGTGYADAYLVFDGGTLKAASTTNEPFIAAHSRLKVQVGDNGGVIDTSLSSVALTANVTDKAGCSGGLTFKGGNSATVTGTLSYTGATSVELGTTLTVANRADIFDTGAGLICIVPEAADRNGTRTLLTTSGDDPFTAADLAKCSASGPGSAGVVFSLSQDGKSILAKFRNGFIICFS